MKILIKNMVCHRCIRDVKSIMEKLKIEYLAVSLGMIELKTELSNNNLILLKDKLLENGFEFVEDKKHQLIEAIKALVIENIHEIKEVKTTNFSIQLVEKLHRDYSYLSSIFSSIEGITIEKYILLHKTERIKELLMYDELNLNEIAFRMGYSSVQHLSNQFKKETGLSPSFFKKIKINQRKSLESLT